MSENLAYQEEWREELIGGKLVAMAPPLTNHTRITGNLTRIFGNYLRGKSCEYLPDGAGLFLEEGTEEYQPDGMIVCDPDKVTAKGVIGAPELVVEVLSRSTAKTDRGHKKDIYEKHGVREYWIISPVELSIEQYILDNGKFVLREVYHKYPFALLDAMKPAERAAVVTEFKCSLYDDLTIRLEDVFDRVK